MAGEGEAEKQVIGEKWGDPISDERQAELRALFERQQVWVAQPEATRGESVFKGVELTGADVSWLAGHSGRITLDIIHEDAPDLHLESGDLVEAHLEGASLAGAHLEGASLAGAHLGNANLIMAHLEGAYLTGAHLEGALLSGAHLEGAELLASHLESAYLYKTHLESANLTLCWFDSRSVLRETILDSRTRLGDIHWCGVGVVDLTQVAWDSVSTLGDERGDLLETDERGIGLRAPLETHVAVVRAYRQVATQLRAQGMNEVADHFLYRGQIRQRWMHLSALLHDSHRPWRWPGDLARYLGSLFLAVLAGYGYRPGRTLFWYVATILSFMGGYLLVTHGISLFGLTEPLETHPLHWYEALVLSLASFHGRGFFPQGINLGDPVAILAACEAVIGLFVEISFIATFTQRFFAR